MKDWIECQSCGTEYRIVSDSTQAIEFCPYCGEPIDDEEEDMEYDLDEE